MTAQEVLAKVLEAGGQVISDPERPRLLVPRALKPLVAEHRESLRRLVLQRAQAPLLQLDAKTVQQVLGATPDPESIKAVEADVRAALAQVEREIRSGQIGEGPILILGRPLADWLSLDEVARWLRRRSQ